MADESAKPRQRSAADPPFPFVAVVGQNAIKRGLLLSVVNPRITGLLLTGQRDTGKSTAARGLAELLPNIDAAAGCPVHCIPTAKERCPACKASGNPAARVSVRMPFVEIPISSTREKLLGNKGSAKPGLLARANRGFAFIERVNLFSEDLLEVVLDSMESRKAESGGEVWPAAFTLIATMNDDEGELPEEIRKRFTLRATARSLTDIEERIEIVQRVKAYKSGPAEFAGHNAKESALVRERLAGARKLISRADVPAKVSQAIERLAAKIGAGKAGAASLREAALANAVYDGRSWSSADDLAEVVDFALQHQIREK
jgi:Mg-chelatase subunit ChlI